MIVKALFPALIWSRCLHIETLDIALAGPWTLGPAHSCSPRVAPLCWSSWEAETLNSNQSAVPNFSFLMQNVIQKFIGLFTSQGLLPCVPHEQHRLSVWSVALAKIKAKIKAKIHSDITLKPLYLSPPFQYSMEFSESQLWSNAIPRIPANR